MTKLRRTRCAMRAAVIGAGQSGIAAAVKLKQAGYDNFAVFERSPGPGGTWYDSKFPGAAVDVHSYCYSYAFNHHDWSKNYADATEVQEYLDATIDKFKVRDHFRFGTEVVSAVWSDQESRYDVTLANGEVLPFDIVVSCLGLLNNPAMPNWPGLEKFRGPAFHSARWESDRDLTGMRVAVVGMGSSAAQIVPAL